MSEENLLNLGPAANDAPISSPMAVSMIALNLAMKYHDINTVQDGTLYQQYKLEGKNMEGLHLDMVFETAKRIELHLMTSSREIAQMLVDGVMSAISEDPSEVDEQSAAEGCDAARLAPGGPNV